MKKNVLFVIMDGCRAQSLGCYGYTRRDTSPTVDALARDGALVDRLYATSNCTMPSVISMMTGTYPAQHRAAGTWSYYDGRYPFLTDLLRRHGYQTYYASNSVTAMSPEWGFIRGYDRAYRAGREINWFRDSAEQRRGVRTTPPLDRLKQDLFKLARRYFPDRAEAARVDAQLAWYRSNDRGSAKAVGAVERMLSERDRDKPFFMFVNLADTHHPFFAIEPFSRTWSALRITKALLMVNLNPGEFYDLEMDLTPDERVTLVEMYDTCVRYVDHCVGRMLAALRQAGVGDDTIVMIGGDHGGETYEHNQYLGSTSFSYEPEIRVPLIIAGSDLRGRIDGLHTVADIFPTVLDLCGIDDARDPAVVGRSLLREPDGHAAVVVDVPAWPRWLKDMVQERSLLLRYGRAFRTLIKRNGTKVIWTPEGAHEIYDLPMDPQETANAYRPATSLPLINDVADFYEHLLGPIGRRLEIYEHADVGQRLSALPPLAAVNPGFAPASVVTL